MSVPKFLFLPLFARRFFFARSRRLWIKWRHFEMFAYENFVYENLIFFNFKKMMPFHPQTIFFSKNWYTHDTTSLTLQIMTPHKKWVCLPCPSPYLTIQSFIKNPNKSQLHNCQTYVHFHSIAKTFLGWFSLLFLEENQNWVYGPFWANSIHSSALIFFHCDQIGRLLYEEVRTPITP